MIAASKTTSSDHKKRYEAERLEDQRNAEKYKQDLAQYERDLTAWDVRQQAKVDQCVIAEIKRLWSATNGQTRSEIEALFERNKLERPDGDWEDDSDPSPDRPREPMRAHQRRLLETRKRVAPIITAEMTRLGNKGVCMTPERFEKHFAKLISEADMEDAFEEYANRVHEKDGVEYERDSNDRWRKVSNE